MLLQTEASARAKFPPPRIVIGVGVRGKVGLRRARRPISSRVVMLMTVVVAVTIEI